MKSKDLQKLVLSKYKTGQTQKKIFEDLNGVVSYRTVKRWCKMIWETGAIDLLKPSGCHRTVRKKAAIQKIKRSKESQRVVKGFLAENWRLKWTCLSQVLVEFSRKILK